MGDLSENFSTWEFVCPCKCGKGTMSPEFIERLQSMRDDVPQVIRINSGIRCIEHNIKVGGSPESEHLPDANGLVEGADLAYSGSKARYLFLQAALWNFKRVGLSKNFIHVGSRADKAQGVLWLYPPKEKKETNP